MDDKKRDDGQVSSSKTKLVNFDEEREFSLSNEKFFDFMIKYCEDAYQEKDEMLVCGQKVTNIMPLIIDFVLSYDTDSLQGDFPYESTFPNKLAEYCTRFLKDLLREPKERDLLCFIFETDGSEWKSGKISKFGIRFHYPYCRLEKNFIEKEFKKGLYRRLNETKLLERNEYSGLCYTPIEASVGKNNYSGWERIIRPVKSFYPFYLSRERDTPPYVLKGFVKNKTPDEIIEDMNGIYEVTYHKNFVDGIWSLDDYEVVDEGEDYKYIFFLPFLFLLDFGGEPNKLDESARKILKHEEEGGVIDDNKDIRLLYFFLNLVNDKRYLEYTFLREIGKILYNIGDGDEKTLNHWIDISKKKFTSLFIIPDDFMDREEYESLNEEEKLNTLKEFYSEFKNEAPLTIRTLAFYAEKDNKEKYLDWHLKWCKDDILKACYYQTDSDIASVILKAYWTEIIYDSENDTFLLFDRSQHRLINNKDNANTIQGLYFNNFCIFLNNFMKICDEDPSFINKNSGWSTLDIKELDIGKDDSGKEKTKTVKVMINDIIKKLKNFNTSSRIYKMLSRVASIEQNFKFKIHEHINKNEFLMATKNCVIEIDHYHKRAFHREGKPEDYITQSSHIEYPKTYSDKHKNVLKYRKYMKQLFIDEELRNFMYLYLAGFLRCRNVEKKIIVLIGDTNGGKSIFQHILQKVLGTNMTHATNALLTEKPKAGNNNPELVKSDRKRMIMISEPEAKDEIRSGDTKKLSGGDTTTAKGLYKETDIDVEAVFRIMLVLNCVPNISSTERAIKERFWFVPMITEFVTRLPEECDGSEESCILNKKFIKEDIDRRAEENIAQAMLWCMVRDYKDYAKKPLEAPKIMDTYMREYWSNADQLICFICEKLERKCIDGRKPDENYKLKEGEVYNLYRSWYTTAFSDRRGEMNRKDFVNNMKFPDKLGPTKYQEWTGWKVIDTDEGIKI